MRTFTVQTILERRGDNVPASYRDCVDNMSKLAKEIQRRFELAEETAFLLEEMLGSESGVAECVENTYEGNAFSKLRFQLFRLLIVDICAAVLDSSRASVSIRTLLKQLSRNNASAIDALKAYYADPRCLEVTVEGEDLGENERATIRQGLIDKTCEESTRSIQSQWAEVQADSSILDCVGAKRVKWARDKVIAHYEKTSTALVALDDDPPHGAGKLTWIEPIQLLRRLKPFTYNVIGLITSTSWDTGYGQFYARAFWDRFKNGATDLQP